MKISVITVVYNGEKEIDKTILSIINQTYKKIEFIIIDGNSKDNTVKIVNKYINKINYFVSEIDEGIYDAMNKGLKKVTGDFVIFMNAGDMFYNSETIERFINQIVSKDKVYFGRAKVIDNDSVWLYPSREVTNNNIGLWLKHNLPNHQAMFFPRSFYQLYSYNTSYKIGSDSDYKFQSQKDSGFVFIDDIICEFEFGGVSSVFTSFKVVKQILKDSWRISLKHQGLIYAITRQIKIISKYVINILFGNSILKQLINKYRK